MSSGDDEPTAAPEPRGDSSQAGRDVFSAGRDMVDNSSGSRDTNSNANSIVINNYPPSSPPGERERPRGESPPSARPESGSAPGSPRPSQVRTAGRRSWVTWAVIGTVAVLIAVGVVAWNHYGNAPGPVTTVRMWGEDPLFNDPRVTAELRGQGLAVQQNSPDPEVTCGNPGVIAEFDISDSSKESASCYSNLAQKERKIANEYDPFGGLMVIMTYKPVVALLKQLHVVSEINGITVFDVKQYLKVFSSGERWSEIPGNTAYPSQSRILLSSTDPKQSNLGAILADIAYAAQNGGDTPTSIGPRDSRVPAVRNLFSDLGELQNNSVPLVNQFLSGGMGENPMAMVYEDQYLDAVLTHEATDPTLTAMYPTPEVSTDDTLVAWTPAGKKLIAALQSPQIAAIEEGDGFRTGADNARFVKDMAGKGIAVPDLDELRKTLQFTTLATTPILKELVDAVAINQPG